MLQATNGPQPAKFCHQDAQDIISILGNQPLQNLQAAESLKALITRFAIHVGETLGPSKPAPKQPVAPAAGKKAK